MTVLTREQMEDRLAALHQASLELVQDIALESLLHRIAAIAAEQAGARYAAVGVLDERGELVQFLTVGMSESEKALIDHPPQGFGLIGALMHARTPIRVASIQKDPRSVGFPENHPPMTSFLGVPIRHGERQLGQIYLTDKIEEEEFSLEDQRVIETLASYAAVAISNARLYRQLLGRDEILIRRNENLALLNELASTLASTTDRLEEILDKALTQVMDYLSLETGELYLRQGDSTIMNLTHQHSRNGLPLWQHNSYKEGKGMVGVVAQSGQYSLLRLPNFEETELNRTAVDEGRLKHIACFPLPGRRMVLGVLCVGSSSDQPFDALGTQFLSTIGVWIGTVIENLRLNLQQRRLAVLEERERIGMDLHDGIIQSIYAVGLTLEHARLLMPDDPAASQTRIDQAINDLNSTIRDIRAYILDLRPRQLHDDNLLSGIQRLVSEFRANTLVEVTLQVPQDGVTGLPDVQTLALFHICQEALANVAKHARATHVEVSVWVTTERALLEVRDDGRGFNIDKTRLALGHGLSNMQTRAHNVGGEVEIVSEPGEGTSVLAWVPFNK